MNDFANNKIKFGIGQAQSLTISSWEQTEFNGKPGMKYNTSDGKFFDASPGLIKLLQAVPVQMGQTIVIEKRTHPEMQYGCFYVDGRNFEEVSSGAPVMPTTATTPPPMASTPVAPLTQPMGQPADANQVLVMRLQTLEGTLATLQTQVAKLSESQLF